MTISADLKNRNDSARFFLVKITPSRLLTDWESLGSSIWQVTLPAPAVESVYLGDTALSVSSGTPAAGEYHFDESTGALRVHSVSEPSDAVASYAIYFSSDIARVVGDDPESPDVNKRTWLPRLMEYPAASQALTDLFQGVFSLSDTNIKIASPDGYMHQFLTRNDSFYNKTAQVWLCVNDVSNITKFYQGAIRSISGDAESVTLSLFDAFAKLSAPALMGDLASECWATAATFPTMNPDAEGRPIPLILSNATPFGVDDIPDFLLTGLLAPKVDILNKAVCCTDYTVTPSTTTGRTWVLCRVPSTLKTLNFGTINTFTAFTPSGSPGFITFTYTVDNAGTHNLEIGDNFRFTHSSTTFYGIVARINTARTEVVGISWTNIFTWSSIPTFPSQSPLTVILKDRRNGQTIIPLYKRHYDYTLTPTEGGHNLLTVTFNNGFESDLPSDSNYSDGKGWPNNPNYKYEDGEGYKPLSPDTYDVHYIVRQNGAPAASALLKDMLEDVGIPVDDASFDTPADSFALTPVQMQIPRPDESDFGTYLDYAGKILSSLMALIVMNADLEAELKLIDPPTSSDEVDENALLSDGVSFGVEYQDIVTALIAYNDYLPQDTAAATASDAVLERLHSIKNPTQFVHCLSTIASRLPDIFAARSSRFMTYTWRTATRDLDAVIGDDQRLVSPAVPGGGAAVKIIGISKAVDAVDLTATDLGG